VSDLEEIIASRELDNLTLGIRAGLDRIDRIMSVLHMPPGGAAYELGAIEPRMVSLHLLDQGDGDDRELVLFGVDDATSRVVFEIGDVTVEQIWDAGGPRPQYGVPPPITRFRAKCELAGYVPSWWDRVQMIDWDLREPFGAPTGAG
jgi:hypothetical protein